MGQCSLLQLDGLQAKIRNAPTQLSHRGFYLRRFHSDEYVMWPECATNKRHNGPLYNHIGPVLSSYVTLFISKRMENYETTDVQRNIQMSAQLNDAFFQRKRQSAPKSQHLLFTRITLYFCRGGSNKCCKKYRSTLRVYIGIINLSHNMDKSMGCAPISPQQMNPPDKTEGGIIQRSIFICIKSYTPENCVQRFRKLKVDFKLCRN